MKKSSRAIAAFLGMAAMFGGMAAPQANNSPVNQHQAVNMVGSNAIHQKRKRTPLGTVIPKRGRHQFKLILQKSKKHTNRQHLKAKHRRKRIRNGRK